jgi:MurNAc alpha-1-phosphate uridylyltransferase
MSIDSALVFAAGFGTRMGGLTKSTPKPLLNVAAKPLIDYALELVQDANIKNIVVNVHYLPEQIEAHLASNPNVKTLREAPDVLETGGGLKNALPLLGNGPVITLNSDAIWTGENPLKLLVNNWNPETMDALLLLVPTYKAQEHRGCGDFMLSQDLRLTRRGNAQSAPYVYTGAQIIKTELLSEVKETSFSLNLLWDKMLKSKRAFGVVHEGGWVDVGRPEGIQIAAAELARHSNV